MLQGAHVRDTERTSTAVFPETEADRAAIREQLARILADPLFTNSRRYPALLSYVAEKTLAGHADSLKERTVGMDVFGREPQYDTNADHVVRSSAAEVRKRLNQYYMDPGRENEIRIELPAGSYAPLFRVPAYAPPLVEAEPAHSGSQRPTRENLRPRHYRWLVASLGLISVAVAWRWVHVKSPLDLFWDPVVGGPAVALCIGNADPPSIRSAVRQDEGGPVSIRGVHDLHNERVGFLDAVTVSRLAGFLQARNARYQILYESSTTLARLREGPSVLIGAFDNEWTIRLTRNLRFYFGSEAMPDCSFILDRRNPSNKSWSVCWLKPYLEMTDDYAVVSRVRDPTTEQVFVVAAGLGKNGTVAAGEFLTSGDYMAELARQAPPDWDRKNFQAVIGTKVIRGSSGPPRILATHFW